MIFLRDNLSPKIICIIYMESPAAGRENWKDFGNIQKKRNYDAARLKMYDRWVG